MKSETSDASSADNVERGQHLFLLIVGTLLATELTLLMLSVILGLSPLGPLGRIVLLLGLAFLIRRGYGWARYLMGVVVAMGAVFGFFQVVFSDPGIATRLVFFALSGALVAFAWLLFSSPSLQAYQQHQKQRQCG